MNVRNNIRYWIIGVVMALGVIALIPSLVSPLPAWWTKILPSKAVGLGLDLKGGMEVLLRVETEEAVKNSLTRLAGDLKTVLKDKGIRYETVDLDAQGRVAVELRLPRYRDEAMNLLKKEYPNVEVGEEGETRVVAFYSEAEKGRIMESSVGQALETIRSRVDEFGVVEPTILRQGTDRILIQLPGIDDPDRAISLIKRTAVLKFMIVDDNASVDDPGPGNVVLYGKEYDPATKAVSRTTYVLKDRILLTGDTIKDARVRYDSQFGAPYVSMSFDSVGANLFDQATAENVRKRLAIVLDDNVYSAPVIRERISGGEAMIEGSFTPQEASDLAIVLRSGSLPAPVEILQKWTVSPTLGKDSISKGLWSMAVGFGMVVLFMVFYYGFSGLVANLALVLNIVIIMAGLALLQASLTLPGIAGIVLTMGMAVDANVLIFERVREELRAGKTVRAALEAGYSRAFLTILDSNLTTIIAALVLFQFGTGSIRGFAATLSIGIAASMFTAIFVTHTVFNSFTAGRTVEKLSI